MKVFVAGGTGVVGVRLVPALVARGHEVVATTRSPSKGERLRSMGAEPVVLDAFDESAVKEALARFAPEVIVNELTALPDRVDMRRIERDFEATNRLRTEGNDHLVRAAQDVSARRFVAQSYAAWPYERRGGPVKTEDDPLDPDPPRELHRALDAIRHLERAVLGAADLDGVALRYGAFYGPDTSLAVGGSVVETIRARRFPIVGSGEGVWSFVHIDDAASATLAAIEGEATGVFNVTDDEPAAVREWLPVLADAIGAPSPRHIPTWLARPLIGQAGVAAMTNIRGASNAKVKREFGWSPSHPSWREGFRTALA
jgi:nucleoside-diphosphate-sugar epimerase